MGMKMRKRLMVASLMLVSAACSRSEPASEAPGVAEVARKPVASGQEPGEAIGGYDGDDPCVQEHQSCQDQAAKEEATCERINLRVATDVCEAMFRVGRERDYYTDVETCVDYQLNGFPGAVWHGDNHEAPWSIGETGKILRGDAAEGDKAKIPKATVTLTYPPEPVDRKVFRDCAAQRREASQTCILAHRSCNSDRSMLPL